jgi:CRISPR-associated endonuclease/helicase Cas3
MSATFSSLDLTVRSIWAKSGESRGHSLLAHMLDVAAVAEVLLEREPAQTRRLAAQWLNVTQQNTSRCIAALVGLHDFGKSIPGFQAKWPEGQDADQEAGLAFSEASKRVTDHAYASAALLGEYLLPLGFELAWVQGVLQAISAHHGYNLNRREMSAAKPCFEGAAWSNARKLLFEAYWKTLSPEGIVGAKDLTLPAVEWLAGLTSVSDWIGSNIEWFPIGERADSLESHFERAKQLASQALDTLGWPEYKPLLTSSWSVDSLIQRIVQGSDLVTARPLQVEGVRLLSEVKCPALLLVEAPMGEGKTELAFLAHLHLQDSNQHRGFYVALPTQATGNALFERALTFLRSFAEDAFLDIQLVHGGAQLEDSVQHLRGIYGDRGDNISSSAWFSQRRRGLLSPYGVGTIDQALFASLNVKHHFVRLWGLTNRVVVLDEIHAYDTYTSALIESLLRWLKALDCSVVLMTATLPEKLRNALLQAWGVNARDIPELAYPRLLMTDGHGVRGSAFPSREMPDVRLVAIGEEEDEESLAWCALECLKWDGCGAVIVNTVQRAQEVYRQVKAQVGEDVLLILFHARFPADERSAREGSVLKIFSKDGVRPRKALLIATQVAEQSLDIDFDFLITDLAPVDLVLQRAGRLHRHQRVRPSAHSKARLFVAGLLPDRLPELKKTSWEYVYDPYILGRTWALLSREDVLQFPADIDRLVQAVYDDHHPLPFDLPEDAVAFIENKAYGSHLGRLQAERQLATNAAIDPAAEPQNAYLEKPRWNEEGEGLGISNRTRLGDDSIALVPVHVVSGGWALFPNGDPFNPNLPLTDSLAKSLFARQLKLSRKDIVLYFSAQETPASFGEHPLLRHLKLLIFEEGIARIGSLTLHLDKELGLVYEKSIDLLNHKEKA